MDTLLDCPTPGGRLQVRVAKHFVERAVGLLVGSPLEPTEGLLISPCSSIHTVGMRYPIDVVFLDRQGRILRVYKDVPMGRVRFALRARAVLELSAGSAARHGLTMGLHLAELVASLA